MCSRFMTQIFDRAVHLSNDDLAKARLVLPGGDEAAHEH